MHSVTRYEMALHLAEGIGGVTARNLLTYFGSAEDIFKAKKNHLLHITGIGQKISQSLHENKERLLALAEEELEKAAKKDIQTIFIFDDAYPKRLKLIDDAPILIYQKGKANLNTEKSIAVVGTRQATNYGKEFTEELISQLKEYNILIVSGLAYGIDIEAHKAALKYQLPTIAVLANGLDMVYPSVHTKIAEEIIEKGGLLLSEFPIGTKPDAPRFPARNRITAALADVVIVVESKRKGGAMITAQYANDYNRDVMAVPGSIYASSSEGCNFLIKNHQAHLLSKTQDLLALMNWDIDKNKNSQKNILVIKDLNLPDLETNILEILFERNQASLDELSILLKSPLGNVSVAILNLEMQDLINALPGKRFSIKQKFYK